MAENQTLHVLISVEETPEEGAVKFIDYL